MSSDGISLTDEALKSLIGEATSMVLPGLQTVLRFTVVQLREDDPIKQALAAALEYRFAAVPPATGDGKAPELPEVELRAAWFLGGPRRRRIRSKAEKQAHSEAKRMADEHGLNVPALLAVSADAGPRAAEELLPPRSDAAIEGILAPLHMIRSELAYATQPLVPTPRGWRQHIADALTAAARDGVTSDDEKRREQWKTLLRHSLGIGDGYADRAPDWGRLVAAAFEYEMRKAEGAKLQLSAQLDQAEVASKIEDLARTASLAQRSLSRLALAMGVLAFVAVAVTLGLAVSLVL